MLQTDLIPMMFTYIYLFFFFLNPVNEMWLHNIPKVHSIYMVVVQSSYNVYNQASFVFLCHFQHIQQLSILCSLFHLQSKFVVFVTLSCCFCHCRFSPVFFSAILHFIFTRTNEKVEKNKAKYTHTHTQSSTYTEKEKEKAKEKKKE